MENTPLDDRFHAEHGLSLFVQTADHTILFDIGQSDLFAENADKLGVDLASVDLAVLSHGHYDHGGGLKRFLEINDTAPVYVNRNAFLPCYSGRKKYIGLDPALRDNGRLRFTGDHLLLDDTLTLCTENNSVRKYFCNSFGLNVLRGDDLLPDDFRHEQYLVIQENGRRIVLSGCSHKGILNIVDWLHPDVLIGGFHFKDLDVKNNKDQAILDDAATRLLSTSATYYTCHCTGVEQFDYLKQHMGNRLHYLSAGQVLTL